MKNRGNSIFYFKKKLSFFPKMCYTVITVRGCKEKGGIKLWDGY